MLDKIQIAALRRADRICFHRLADGTSHICAVKENRPSESDPFARDIDMRIPCDSTLVDYDTPRIDRAPWIGFEWVSSCNHAPEWTTIATLLRPDDSITLEWLRGAWSNEVLKEKSICADALKLRIQRGEKRLTFQIGHSIGLDNTARMIRRA